MKFAIIRVGYRGYTEGKLVLDERFEEYVEGAAHNGIAVGVYFVTQSPSDIPGDVLAQLSNRVQHGLRAYTPADQKGAAAGAQSRRSGAGE